MSTDFFLYLLLLTVVSTYKHG